MDELFVITLALLGYLLLRWAFRVLPKEQWQILAARPAQKDEDGAWKGTNFTYYGFFIATAYVSAVVIAFILMGALRISLTVSLSIVAVMAAVCVPASRVVARVVERKKHTLTVGGASFAGIVAAPWAIWLVNRATAGTGSTGADILPVLAVLSTAYAIGEGLGRLACISFGCCYGRPLSEAHPFLQRLFRKRCFVFSGHTKKIAYAHSLDGTPVIPVQAMTSVVFLRSGLIGVYLILKGYYTVAFLETLLTTQLWRLYSETLRADYRGGGRISAYQIMAAVGVVYSLAIAFLFPVRLPPEAIIGAGLQSLWNPLFILFVQALWIGLFLYMGRSRVTASTIRFHVLRDRV